MRENPSPQGGELVHTGAFLLLAALAMALVYLQEAWLGIICAVAAVIVLLAGFVGVGAHGAKAFAGGVRADLNEEYKAFDEHGPKGPDTSVFADVASGLGEKAGEALAKDEAENLRWASPRLGERAEKGTKSMFDAFMKLFRK